MRWRRPSIHFNLTALNKNVTVVRAELYMLTSQPQTDKTQKVKVVLYDIFTGDKILSRALSSNESGWSRFVFRSSQTVNTWIKNPTHNHGVEMRFSNGMEKLEVITAAKRMCIYRPWLTLYYYGKSAMISNFANGSRSNKANQT